MLKKLKNRTTFTPTTMSYNFRPIKMRGLLIRCLFGPTCADINFRPLKKQNTQSIQYAKFKLTYIY